MDNIAWKPRRARLALAAISWAALSILGAQGVGSAAAALCDGTWRIENVPVGAAEFQDVAATRSGELWIVGGDTVTSRVDGQWTQSRLPAGTSLQGVAARSGAVWVSGADADGRALVARWSGSTWERHVIVPRRLVLTGISVSSPGNVWLSGYVITNSAGETRAVVLRYDGTQWTRRSFRSASYMSAIDTTAADNTWVVGPNRKYALMSWHWNGEDWQREAINAPGYDLLEVASVVALPNGGAWTTTAADTGTCCHSFPVTLRHTGRAWKPVLGPTDTYTRPVDLLVGRGERYPTVIGSSSTDSGGGGNDYGVILKWTGTSWVLEPIAGHSNPDGNHWGLSSIDGDGKGNAWAVGSSPSGSPRLIHRCSA